MAAATNDAALVAPAESDAQPDGESRRPRYATGFVNDNQAATAAAMPAVTAGTNDADTALAQAPVAPVAAVVTAPAVIAPIVTRAPAAVPAPAQAAKSNGLPKVQPFQLPLGQLTEVAEGSGLQWVNSDAQKIAAAQAAMAAESKPVHVPRERPAPVVIDEGPLVLVETKRDLSQFQLPD
jgi:ribonuclease E